jgi:hypothetical protein
MVAFTTLAGFGQPREISKEEFKERLRRAESKLSTVSYRERWTGKQHPSRVASESGEMISRISEFVPPDRRREVIVYKLPAGTRQEETVRIGNRKFVRNGDGAWRDVSKDEPNRYSMWGDPHNPVQMKETSTYLHLGVESIKDIETEVIEEIIDREFISNGLSRTYGHLNRLWIAKDGKVVRREWKNSGSDGIVVSHTISEYEYDTNIKIDVPMNK